MSKWHFIFASICVLSIAIVISSFAPAFSQYGGSKSYMVSASDGQFVWRVNISDGSVSFCLRDNAISESAVRNSKPVCSLGSEPAGH